MRFVWLITLLIVTRASSQGFILYSEIHWRPDQTGDMGSEIRKVVGDSAGNTYLLYSNRRDFRVKNSEFLLMKRITSIGSSGEILKLDKSGEFVWGIGLNGGTLSDIACDPKGNLIVSCIGGTIPGHFLLAYLPSSSLMAEGACNLLMKVSPAGDLIWSVKDTNEIYAGLSKVWLDENENIFQYVQSNSWRFEGFVEKRDKSGKQIWSKSLNNTFPYAIEVNRAGETYYSCKTVRTDEKGVPVSPIIYEEQEVWKLNPEGKKTVILWQDWRREYGENQFSSSEGDYFVNQISFNSDNTPVLFCSMLMQHKCGSIKVMGKIYYEEKGSFVFVEIGTDGKIKSDLQLKTTSFIFERDYISSGEIGISKRHGAIYSGNRRWVFGIPVSSTQTEVNPAGTYAGKPITYVNYDAKIRTATYLESESMYIENYQGVRFSYLPDSSLVTYGKRKDEAIPAKPNHTFYWMYIERIQLKEPVLFFPIVADDVAPSVSAMVLNPPVVEMENDTVESIVPAKPYPPLLYPNPTNANSLFQFVMPETTVEGTEANFTVTDGQGKILESRMIAVNAGENKVEVVSAGFAMGTYTVRVVCKELEFHMVLIKI